jgi:DNA-binding CsgD family transcriptional regulator
VPTSEGAALTEFLGRHAEREAVDSILSRARTGRSGALVVRGQAGIGKTALLDHLRDLAVAGGFRVESSTGIEAEAQFAFAGLHQLCAPLLDSADALPEPQQTALGVAFGSRSGAVPGKFLVGLATLNLLAETAEQSPLLCVVDDAQWLDQASAEVLAFVARRIEAERLAMVFAVRDSSDGTLSFAGLPELRLGGLDDAEARELLDAAVQAPIDVRVRERIIAEARGNPLALLELTAQPAQFAGGFQLPGLADVPGRVEEGFQRRFRSLPETAQLLSLVAAAEPTGDVTLLWSAAEQLEIAPESAAPAESAGLLEIDTRVRFRHPLARSAAYRAATPPDRRRAHAALAAATDPMRDPDRRAWHGAQAILGRDEQAAAELERSADRARARGGLAAAAAFLQRSTELTPEPTDRTRRALEAAHAKHEAGAYAAARDLLVVAESGPTDDLQRARLALLRGQIAFHLTRGADVPEMLMDAAETLAPLDAALSRETYLHALDAAIINGGSAGTRIAEAVLDAPATTLEARPVDLLLDRLAVTMVQGYAAGVPALRVALEALRDATHPAAMRDDLSQAWLWLASRAAVGILDDDLAHVLAASNVDLARADGALSRLPAALNFRANVLTVSGQLARAAELVAEAEAITDSIGGVPLRHAHTILAAWRGDRAETIALSRLTFEDASHPADGVEVALAQYARAVLHNGLGDYAVAQNAAARACETEELSISTIALPELIEASIRAGDADAARRALDLLSTRAGACATSWALGLEARSRALTIPGPAAEDHYRAAVARLDESRIAGEAARAHLVYGEWLRRQGRRQEARGQLRLAHDLLSDMGAEAFASRSARELRATGEHPRKRTARPTDQLTAQELTIARAVATGATSPEVGAQLFLSPRTIEAHLRSIFRKLDISSRRQLREMSLP